MELVEITMIDNQPVEVTMIANQPIEVIMETV